MKKEELQKFVDSFHTMTSILSVEKRDDGGIGTIRIEVGNELYVKSMERTDPDGGSVFSQKFVPGSDHRICFFRKCVFEKGRPCLRLCMAGNPVTARFPARLHPCLVECVDYNNTEDDKDLLDYVSDLRSLVKKGQQAEEGPRPAPSPRPSEAPPRLRHPEVAPAPLGLKLYDSPYGENGPRLTAAELPELARRLNVAGENETAQTLLQRFPLLAECGADEGEYWLDLVLQVLRPEKGGQS